MVVLTNMYHKPDNCRECRLKDENGDCLLIKDYWIEQVSKISDLNLDFDEYQEHINNYIKYNYDLILLINNLPYSYSERKKGTWTKDASCPFCGFQPWYEKDIHTLSFCPHCGADLRGEENALN